MTDSLSYCVSTMSADYIQTPFTLLVVARARHSAHCVLERQSSISGHSSTHTHTHTRKGSRIYLLPAGSAAGSSAGISFTHGPILGFFAPQGPLVAPIKVKFGREERTKCDVFHFLFIFENNARRPSTALVRVEFLPKDIASAFVGRFRFCLQRFFAEEKSFPAY